MSSCNQFRRYLNSRKREINVVKGICILTYYTQYKPTAIYQSKKWLTIASIALHGMHPQEFYHIVHGIHRRYHQFDLFLGNPRTSVMFSLKLTATIVEHQNVRIWKKVVLQSRQRQPCSILMHQHPISNQNPSLWLLLSR